MDNFLTFPNIDPVILHIWGPLAIRWYGVAYLAGFVAAWYLGKRRLARIGWSQEQFSDLMTYAFLGVIIGGRVGYMLFYQFSGLMADPLSLFDMAEGGMSFHGGLLGVVAALALFARKHNSDLLTIGDFIAPLVPIGLGLGRVANFINGELWGRTTDVPWAMVFPTGGPLPRHPSQLYEFVLEGVLLFAILWWYSSKLRPKGAVGGLFLVCYGLFRFVVEYFREPDAHLGLYSFGLSQGQLLCLPMIVLGGYLIIRGYQRAPARG